MRHFLLTILAVLPVCLWAQTAAQIMQNAAQRLTSGGAATAHFTITAPDGSSMQGEIAESGDKFVVDTPVVSTVYDGKTQYTIDRDASEVSLYSPEPEELAAVCPFSVIRSHSANFTAAKVNAPAGFYRVKLTPKAAGTSVKYITLTLNASTYLPTTIDIAENSGAVTKIAVTSVNAAAKVPASRFKVRRTDYPGFDFVDLR